jgi:hypothetical protein
LQRSRALVLDFLNGHDNAIYDRTGAAEGDTAAGALKRCVPAAAGGMIALRRRPPSGAITAAFQSIYPKQKPCPGSSWPMAGLPFL